MTFTERFGLSLREFLALAAISLFSIPIFIGIAEAMGWC
jgi:hypothetical protein